MQKMEKIRCRECAGSGQIMGGGMIFKNCDECEGTGSANVTYNELKKTDQFKAAVDEIKSLDPKLTDEDAQAMMKKQFEKSKRKERIK